MTNYSDEEWEEIGRRWRQAAGLNGAARLNAPAFIRWLKHAGYLKDYVCVPAHELRNAEGKHDPDQGIVFYREDVWACAENGEPHFIWTLIHEAAHVICKHRDVRYRAEPSQRHRYSRRTNKDEIEANRLAAAILAPFEKADFKPGMTADDLQAKFGLSHEAAKRRVEEFERMYRRKHEIRRKLPPGIIDFLSEQKRKGYRVTSLRDDEMTPRVAERYEGDPCPCCQAFMLVRSGVGRTCKNCGARTGDD